MRWEELLRSCPYARVLEIAQAIGAITGRRRIRRAHLLEAIETHLARPENRSALLQQLHPLQQAILEALDRAGGVMSVPDFVQRFGPLEAEPVASLQRRGLIFPIAGQIHLPDDIRPSLRFPSSLQLPEPLSPGWTMQHDLCTFLAFLERRPASLHGRWLSPSALRSLVAFMGLLPTPRREMDAPYLTFLHDLAEAAGLVCSSHHVLSITPAALVWLRQPYPERSRWLWDMWWNGEPAPSRLPRTLSRFPRPLLRAALQNALEQWPQHASFPWPELATAAHVIMGRFLPSSLEPPTPEDLIRELLMPVVWLGLLQPPAQGETALTSLGRWLLFGNLRPPDVLDRHDPARIFIRGEPDGLRIEGDLPLDLRFELRTWAEPAGLRADRLTPAGIAAAITRGAHLEDLWMLWRRIFNQDPDPTTRSLLHNWAHMTRICELRTLVQFNSDPEILPQSLRHNLKPITESGPWIVQALPPDRWIRKLQRHGFQIRWEGASRMEVNPSAVDAAWLWLGIELGLWVARKHGRSFPPLRRLRDRLAQAADPIALEGARSLLREMLEMHEDQADSHPASPWGAILERIIQDGQSIELIYAHPMRDQPVAYRLLPLRLIPRGRGRPQPFLLAIDLERGEERNFRLDRIIDLQPLD